MALVRGVVVCSFILWVAVPAFAVDGVIEINQAAAAAGNVTPGDQPGFPVTLSLAGSYRLTGNLDVRNETDPENVTAIEVTADDVQIDLNGFSILGPSVTGSGTGIETPITDPDSLFSASSTTVVNGTVRGMGNRGMNLGTRSRVERVQAAENGLHGIFVGFDSHVLDNNVWKNGFGGIRAGGGTVSGNVVQFNQGIGIKLEDRGLANNNVVHGNTAVGMELSSNTGYAGNAVRDNTGGTVTGGVQLGLNLCNGNTTCP